MTFAALHGTAKVVFATWLIGIRERGGARYPPSSKLLTVFCTDEKLGKRRPIGKSTEVLFTILNFAYFRLL
ncbi:hypothetical protein GGR57DRAFT_469005 [Xylariaceae sp. FL1272]|nr:hypothetical protein GGR57DRAFT_469005 [Xylariaceae sp. FL1272]